MLAELYANYAGPPADVPEGREEWERAFLIITLPLLARNNV